MIWALVVAVFFITALSVYGLLKPPFWRPPPEPVRIPRAWWEYLQREHSEEEVVQYLCRIYDVPRHLISIELIDDINIQK